MGDAVGGLLGGGETKTTSTTVVDLPSWIESPLKRLVPRIERLSNTPYQAYSGQRLADFSNDELAAFGLTRDLVGAEGFNIDPSKGVMDEVSRRGLEGFSQQELQPYMNPYIENVLDIGKRRKFEDFDRQLGEYRGRAGQAAAFGGSRFGLGEAQMLDNFQRQIEDYDTQGLYSAFNEGMGRAVQGTQMAGQAATDRANLESLGQQGGLQAIAALEGIGGKQRALEQGSLDIDYQDFLQEKAYPYEQVQFASSNLLPYGNLMRGSTTTDVTEQPGGGLLSAAVGLGSMALGIPGVSAALGGGMMGMGSALGAGGMMGAGTGMAAGLSGGQIARMGMGGMRGMYGPGFAEGGLVTAIEPLQTGVTTGQHEKILQQGQQPDELDLLFQQIMSEREQQLNQPINPDSDMTRGGLQDLWQEGIFGNPIDDTLEMRRDESGTFRNFDANNPPQRNTNSGTGFNLETYLPTVSYIESKHDSGAVNKNSKAAGRFQFIPDTAKAYGLKDPHDDKQAFKAMKKFTMDNYNTLKKKLKREPTNPEMYFAHQQGATGASKLLANPNKKAVDIVGKKAVTQNGGRADMTAAEFANMWLSKYKALEGTQVAMNGYAEGGVLGGLTNLYKKSPFQEQSKGLVEALRNNDPSQDTYLESGLRGLADKLYTGDEVAELLKDAYSDTKKVLTTPKKDLTFSMSEGAKGLLGAMEGEQTTQPTPTLPTTIQPSTGTAVVPRQQPQTQQRKPSQVLMDVIQKQEQTKAPKQESKKNEFNLPLFMFGAQLLSSDKPFFQALGDAGKAGVTTKLAQEQAEATALREQAEMALKQRSQDLQSLRVQAELERLNTTAPYIKQKNELELLKLLQEIEGGGEDTKRRDNIAKVLMETNPQYAMNPDEAYSHADRLIMSTKVGNNLNNQQNGAMSIEDYLATE